tara:strand:+ start:478 stop:1155 length:678 start_codon:yes stop_codon:yes gene_type:complete
MNHKVKKIFVLDDDDKSNLAIAKVLQGAGYTVKIFNQIDQIKKALEAEVPDAFIVDPHAETTHSSDFLIFRQNDPVFKKVPLIGFTEKISREEIVKMLSLGVHDYLIKPLNARLILSIIKKYLASDEHKHFLFTNEEDAIATIPLVFTRVSETNLVAESAVKLTDDEDGQYRIVSRELEDRGVGSSSFSLSKNTTFVSQEGLFRAYFRWRGLGESVLQLIRSGRF